MNDGISVSSGGRPVIQIERTFLRVGQSSMLVSLRREEVLGFGWRRGE